MKRGKESRDVAYHGASQDLFVAKSSPLDDRASGLWSFSAARPMGGLSSLRQLKTADLSGKRIAKGDS